jgi:hypothetical protein
MGALGLPKRARSDAWCSGVFGVRFIENAAFVFVKVFDNTRPCNLAESHTSNGIDVAHHPRGRPSFCCYRIWMVPVRWIHFHSTLVPQLCNQELFLRNMSIETSP